MDREGGKKEKERGGGREREIKKAKKKTHKENSIMTFSSFYFTSS